MNAWLAVRIAATFSVAAAASAAIAGEPVLAPTEMPRLGTIDERFQSYNIEMVEVTGGRFWRPYDAKPSAPAGDRDLYADRPPTDLMNPRLRRFAAALSPAYLRISGTWANATYFPAAGRAPSTPPVGFNGVLTRDEWRDVVAFADATHAAIVTSFAASSGTRDERGRWRPDQARRFLSFARSIGGHIAAVEFVNEPNVLTGAPDGYDAAAYGRDFATFHTLMRRVAPDTAVLGPGTVGDSSTAAEIFAASARGIDAVSYHYYGDVSARCSGHQSPETALSEQWLARTDRTFAFYRSLRDRLAPGKPIWLTETAQAACGGDRWSATFLDTFRYLDQLGRLARTGVQVVMHNTLAASDYGLLDQRTYLPRPNYWAALLWRRLMGTTVLESGVPIAQGLHVYAHCQRNVPGGVTLLVINNDSDRARELTLPHAATRYTLEPAEAGHLQTSAVRLNGNPLNAGDANELPPLEGTPAAAGRMSFAPATITFLTIPEAGNGSCR